MDWNSGFSALYELKTVDPVSWMDAGSLRFTAGTVNRSSDQLIESADLTMTERIREGWVRVYLKAGQAGGGARVPIFTGLAQTPSRDLDGRRVTYKTQCYSVLKPVDDVLTPRGYYAPAGAPGAQLAAELLSVGPAPVTYDEDSPLLTSAIISEDSDTHLSMAWQIVEAIGWRIRISGDGSVRVCPPALESSARFDPVENDAVEPKLSDEDDWYACPNVFRVVSGDAYAEIRDDDPESELSIEARKASRGGTGEIWAQDTASGLNDGESLSEYARRMLNDAQAHARSIDYTHRFRPDLTVTDKVTLHYPGVGIDGDFRIISQTITLGHGCKTREKVVMA